MRDDVVLAERFRKQAGWWRFTPFITALIIVLITAIAGTLNGVHSNGATVERADVAAP